MSVATPEYSEYGGASRSQPSAKTPASEVATTPPDAAGQTHHKPEPSFVPLPSGDDQITKQERQLRAGQEQEDISSFRERTLTRRSMLSWQRRELRRLRQSASDLEASFFKYIRQCWGDPERLVSSDLAVLFEKMQVARDELGAAEEDYDQAEEAYNTLEFRFSQRESKFFLKYADLDSERFPEEDENTATNSARDTVQPPTPGYSDVVRPPDVFNMDLIDEYLSAVGDVDVLKEELDDIRGEKARLLDQKQLRKLGERTIADVDQEFLDQYDSLYVEKLEELRKAQKGESHLMFKVITSSASVQSRRASDSVNLPARKPYQHDIKKVHSETAAFALLSQFESKNDRVSSWIFDNLRNSPLERARHKATLENRDMDNRTWLEQVKLYWNAGAESGPLSDVVSIDPSAPLSAATRDEAIHDLTRSVSSSADNSESLYTRHTV